MPANRGHDKQGPYYRWGTKGKKYHYRPRNKKSRRRARWLAIRQGRAIKARGG